MMKPDKSIYYNAVTDEVFLNACKRRRENSDKEWNSVGLKQVRENNTKQYLAKYIEEELVDERYQEVYNDNLQFVSVRTIVPFLTARVTAAEIVPANGKDASIQFAHDFEEALQKTVEELDGRMKMRLAVQDVLTGQRVGILKVRLDPTTGKLLIEQVDPSTIVIGNRARQGEEPDYIGQTLKRSINDLIGMFPDKEDKIKNLFNIEAGTPSQMERVEEILEEWLWLEKDGKKELVVGWRWQNFSFGKIRNPNQDENGDNVWPREMVPYVFVNFINDGSSYIDQTSFIEQAKWSQKNYNKRGQTIAENAKYGGTGVPIFAKGAISQKDVAKVRFSPIQRVLLDTADVGKSFTVWQSQPLPNYIMEDKAALHDSIDNMWGSNAALRGQPTDNNTLGQDVINRDQAQGRLSDPVDCIDQSMTRLYQIVAQLMFRYYTEKQYVNFIGNDGKFVSISISRKEISENVGIKISVKAGTSLPLDRSQRRATALELAKMNKIGTLSLYKVLDIFDDPEAAYKEYLLEQTNPATALEEVDKQVFDREAFQDLQFVIAGEIPEEREDISQEYGDYLNNYLLTDKFMLLQQKNDKAAARVSEFVDAIIAKLSRKMNKMQMQPQPDAPAEVGPDGQPIPPEVQAALASAQGGAPQPAAPAQPALPQPAPTL